jgi:hypothetical protein
MTDDKLIINPPLYMVGVKIHCWRCQAKMPVISLLAPKVDDTEEQVCLLSEVEEIPKDVLSYIQSKVPTFRLRYSKMADTRYYANTCPECGVLYGDFFLHDEPGAPFFPENEEDARFLYINEIPLLGPVQITAGLSFGLGEIILRNAKKI